MDGSADLLSTVLQKGEPGIEWRGLRKCEDSSEKLIIPMFLGMHVHRLPYMNLFTTMQQGVQVKRDEVASSEFLSLISFSRQLSTYQMTPHASN